MKDFIIGDRVRVRELPAVGSYAGRVGAVVGISRTPDGAVHGYHVKLDGRLPGNRVDVGIAFGPQELEPEASDILAVILAGLVVINIVLWTTIATRP